MQIRLYGPKDEIEAMREWLPSLFPVVERVRVHKERDGTWYRLYADVYPTGRPPR